MNFEIVKTDISKFQADAIVLPANPSLQEGRGASSAIFQAAGRLELTIACKKLGHCEVGEATATLGYRLKAKYIIHAVVPQWRGGHSDEYGLLSSAYLSSLSIADCLNCKTIAFPLLSSGNNGFNPEIAFRIAQSSIASFEPQCLEKVILVVYSREISEMVKRYGYEVKNLPVDFEKLKKKAEHQEIFKGFAKQGKDIAQQFAEDQIQKGLDYMKVKENREKLLRKGIEIAKSVLNNNLEN